MKNKQDHVSLLDQGVVFTGVEGTDHSSCAFPSICVLDSGRWLCALRAAPFKVQEKGQRPLIARSDNQGRSWTDPVSPFTAPDWRGMRGIFRNANMTSLGEDTALAVLQWIDHSDPALPMFNPKTKGLLNMQLYLSWTHNGRNSWSELEHVNVSPFEVPVAMTGPVLHLPDGELACQFELYKHYHDESELVHAPVLMFSRDGGKSWPECIYPAKDPGNRVFYWDQRPAIIGSEHLLNVFWTFDDKTGEYLNIHAAASEDLGRTWSSVWDTGVPGQPAPVVRLKDGRLVMVYVNRTAEPAIEWRISSDGGKTWPENSGGTIYRASMSQTKEKGTLQKAWTEMEQFSLGLPATAKLLNDEILVVFYAGPKADLTSIRWARLG